MVSSLTFADAKNELEKLIACGQVQYNRELFGCCMKYYVTFPNDNHKYCYNRDKLITNKLRNKIFTHLYIIYNNSLNNNMPISDTVKALTGNTLKNVYRKSVGITKIKAIYDKVRNRRVRKSLTLHSQKYKPNTTTVASALGNYTNAIKISGVKLKGLNGLSYIKYQHLTVKPYLQRLNGLKILIDVEFETIKDDDESTIDSFYTRSRVHTALTVPELQDLWQKAIDDITIDIETKAVRGSGFTIKGIKEITIHINQYNPTRGRSYIPTPEWIANKKATINIQNNDNKCFKYSVQCGVQGIHKKQHPERMTHYKKLTDDQINWDIQLPPTNSQIDKFEQDNNNNISINVYRESQSSLSDDDMFIVAHRITKISHAQHHVDLLLITDDSNKSHYVYITDIDKLLNRQTNKSNGKSYHCRCCLHPFKTKQGLEAHIRNGCIAVEGTKLKLPDEGSSTQFNSMYKKFKCPFVIYADFECVTVKCQTATPNDNKSFTNKYQRHQQCGFTLKVVSAIESMYFEPVVVRAMDKSYVAEQFVKEITKLEKKLMYILRNDEGMIFTKTDEENFNNATVCHFCNKELNDDKVRDHCHLTGKFRGAAHNCCNINYNFKYIKIPTFFHNLKNYDSHLIISSANEFKCKKINVIAQNSEKFITFGFDHLQFKDSYSFLSSSLSKLVKLNKYKELEDKTLVHVNNWSSKFNHSRTNKYVKDNKDLDLLTDKGVYPYDYMDNPEKFMETELPPKSEFYSVLTESDISDKDYEQAQFIWKHFNIKTMGEYHDLYMLTDVLLLADVFENFRESAMLNYELDPAHYFTLPGYAWDAMLLKTDVELDLISDMDMYLMIEKGIRGGMTQVSLKHAVANNKYMSSYNKHLTSSYLMYLDANNLYGLAMSQYLPYKDFQWCHTAFSVHDILNYDETSETNYILDVDLEYPAELHDLHCDFPLAPELVKVSSSMLSEQSKQIYKSYHQQKTSDGGLTDPSTIRDDNTSKLVLNLQDKHNYIIHMNNLKYYLEKGMILKQINRCISFTQKQWLKPWIDFNTEKRTKADNDFEKDFFKLMNNAVFGKTMENVRNHIDFELVNNSQRLGKIQNEPVFKHAHIINESLVGVEKIRTVTKLNKPIYLGFSILELSKLHMYKFYYDTLKPFYNDRVKLCYTDTDSFVLHIETEDVYDDFNKMDDLFDFSSYPSDHKSYSKKNKKVLGKFKDEVDGKIIEEFIGLKPKMYSIKIHTGKPEEDIKKKAKGIPTHKVKKLISFQDYYNTLMENLKTYIKFNTIRSFNHQICSITCNKLGLSSFDNKRHWLDYKTSVPYGHYGIATH